MPSVLERKLSCQPRFDSAHELHDPNREDHLANPEQEHPLDNGIVALPSITAGDQFCSAFLVPMRSKKQLVVPSDEVWPTPLPLQLREAEGSPRSNLNFQY